MESKCGWREREGERGGERESERERKRSATDPIEENVLWFHIYNWVGKLKLGSVC